jgi:hypothetical protein
MSRKKSPAKPVRVSTCPVSYLIQESLDHERSVGMPHGPPPEDRYACFGAVKVHEKIRDIIRDLFCPFD